MFRPLDPCQRRFYLPGELAQWDLWQPDRGRCSNGPVQAKDGFVWYQCAHEPRARFASTPTKQASANRGRSTA